MKKAANKTPAKAAQKHKPAAAPKPAKPSKAAQIGDIVLVYTDSPSGPHYTAPAVVLQANEGTSAITAKVFTPGSNVTKNFSYSEEEEVGTWKHK